MHQDNLRVLKYIDSKLQVGISYSCNFTSMIIDTGIDRMILNSILKELNTDKYIEYGAFNGNNDGNLLLTVKGHRAANNDEQLPNIPLTNINMHNPTFIRGNMNNINSGDNSPIVVQQNQDLSLNKHSKEYTRINATEGNSHKAKVSWWAGNKEWFIGVIVAISILILSILAHKYGLL